jgi:hypothetical protein
MYRKAQPRMSKSPELPGISLAGFVGLGCYFNDVRSLTRIISF